MEKLQTKLDLVKNEIVEIENQINLIDKYAKEELVKYQNVMLECNGIKDLQVELTKLKSQIETLLKNGENETSPIIESKKKDFKRKLNKFKTLKEEYDYDVKEYENYLREVKGETELKETLAKKQKEADKILELMNKEKEDAFSMSK